MVVDRLGCCRHNLVVFVSVAFGSHAQKVLAEVLHPCSFISLSRDANHLLMVVDHVFLIETDEDDLHQVPSDLDTG